MRETLARWLFNPTVSRLLAAMVAVLAVLAVSHAMQKAVTRRIGDVDTRYRARKVITLLGYFAAAATLAVVSARVGDLRTGAWIDARRDAHRPPVRVRNDGALTVVTVSAMYRKVMTWVTDGTGGSGLSEEEFGAWAVKVNAGITCVEYTLTFLVSMAALVTLLQTAGVNLNSLLVVGGAVGIGVGLGLQTPAGHFASGLVLLLEQPIKLGDRVEVGGVLGDVVRIAGRSTWVRTNDNVVIIVPNSEFTSNRVTNWTANDRSVRFSLPVGVSYGSHPAKVREALLATARKHPDVLEDPSPDVLFLGFGDSALNFELRVWTVRQVQTPRVLASDLYFAIFDSFRAQGIEMPFPQRDVHVKSVAGPMPVSPA